MSAMGAIVRVPPPDEIAADGTVIPLRDELPTVEPVQQSASELGPVSPELALVDPELARAARERLPDPRRPIAVAEPAVAEPAVVEPAVVEHLPSSVEPAPELAPPRRRRRLGLLASAAGIIALGMLLTLLVGRDKLTGRQAQQTQSVAAAVSPSVATVTKPEPAATTAAEPANSAGPSTTPAKPAPVHATAVPGKTFIWVKSPDAAAYEFQLFEGNKRVFRARVKEPRLELPGRWRQAGRPHALLPGSYRWYVWTIDKRTNRPSAKPTVSAKLMIDK
jgi:hypothetical protein